MDIYKYIKEKIKQLTKNCGLTQGEVSVALGYNKNYLANMYNANNGPSFESLVQICDYFNITLSEFFANYVSKTPQAESIQQQELVKEILNKTMDIESLESLLWLLKVTTKEDMEFLVKYIRKLQVNR